MLLRKEVVVNKHTAPLISFFLPFGLREIDPLAFTHSSHTNTLCN